MTDQETMSYLTKTLNDLKLLQPSVSLRMWFNPNGQLNFFFTNLPPRKKRNYSEKSSSNLCTVASNEEDAPPYSPTSVKGSEVDLPSKCPTPEVTPPLVAVRGGLRGRK